MLLVTSTKLRDQVWIYTAFTVKTSISRSLWVKNLFPTMSAFYNKKLVHGSPQ